MVTSLRTPARRVDSAVAPLDRRVRLDVSDYERVFDVLELCDDATDVADFRHRVIEGVSRVFNLRHVTFFSGPTLAQTFVDPHPLVTGDATGGLVREYRDVWSKRDVFATPRSINQLRTKGWVSLDQVRRCRSASTYVDGFLHRIGLESASAFALTMPRGRYGLVGLFDPDRTALATRNLLALRLLFRRLRPVTQALPDGARRDETLPGLSARQRQVVNLVVEGFSNAQIAQTLELTEDTVKKYVSRTLATTGCRTRTELAVRAMAP